MRRTGDGDGELSGRGFGGIRGFGGWELMGDRAGEWGSDGRVFVSVCECLGGSILGG